jgi:hypothetical protein
LMERPLAANVHTRRCGRLRATRAHPEGCCVGTPRPESRRIPIDGRVVGHPEVVPWRLVAPADSSKLESRSRARQSSSSPGRPRLGPEGPVPSPIRRMESRHRSAEGAVGEPHIPREVVIRRGHRSARAEMDRSPSRAFPTGVGSASVPSAPKRFRKPRPVQPGRAVIRTCRLSRQRTFPKIRSSR